MDLHVLVAVARQLMASLDNAPDGQWISLCNPAKCKECADDRVVCEHPKDRVHVTLDAAWVSGPLLALHLFGKVRDLEIILHVDCHCPDDLRCARIGGCRADVHAIMNSFRQDYETQRRDQ